MATPQQTISSIKAQLDALNKQIAALQATISTQTATIAARDAEIAALKAEIVKLKARIAELEGITPPPPPPPPPPSTGGYPDASNTGVPVGTVLTQISGRQELRTQNMVVQNSLINGDVVAMAPGIIVRRCKIIGGGFWSLPVTQPATIRGLRNSFDLRRRRRQGRPVR